MDAKNFPAELDKKLRQVRQLIRRDMPRIVGMEAVEHFTDNFRRGGFMNGGLQRWQDVKRRDPTSRWYGFEYKAERRTYYAFNRDKTTGKTYKAKAQKRLNYSETATTRKVLTSKRNYLMNSFGYRAEAGKTTVYNDAPHAQIHNEGGTFKVFGKATATMPKRQIIGHSKELNKKIENELLRQLDRIFK